MEATSLDQIAYSLQASGGEWAALRVRAGGAAAQSGGLAVT